MNERRLTIDDDTPVQPVRCVTDEEICSGYDFVSEELVSVLEAEDSGSNEDQMALFGRFGFNFNALLQFCGRSVRGDEFERLDKVFDEFPVYCKLVSLVKGLQKVFSDLNDLENKISNLEIVKNSFIEGENKRVIWLLIRLESRKIEVKKSLDADRKKIFYRFLPFLIEDYKYKCNVLNMILNETKGFLRCFEIFFAKQGLSYGVVFRFLNLSEFWKSSEPIVKSAEERLMADIDEVLAGFQVQRLRLINFGARLLQAYESNLATFSDLSTHLDLSIPTRMMEPLELSQTVKRRFSRAP